MSEVEELLPIDKVRLNDLIPNKPTLYYEEAEFESLPVQTGEPANVLEGVTTKAVMKYAIIGEQCTIAVNGYRETRVLAGTYARFRLEEKLEPDRLDIEHFIWLQVNPGSATNTSGIGRIRRIDGKLCLEVIRADGGVFDGNLYRHRGFSLTYKIKS